MNLLDPDDESFKDQSFANPLFEVLLPGEQDQRLLNPLLGKFAPVAVAPVVEPGTEARNKRMMAQMAKLDHAVLEPEAFFKAHPLDESFAPDLMAERKAVVNQAFKQFHNGGQPVAGGAFGSDLMRHELAGRLFKGRGGESEDAFHAQIVLAAQGRKDSTGLRTAVHNGAMESAALDLLGRDHPKTWAATRAELQGKPGYTPDEDADLYEAWQDSKSRAAATLAHYAPQLGEVRAAMESGGAGTLSEVLLETAKAVAEMPLGKSPSVRPDAEMKKADAAATAFKIYTSLAPDERDGFMDSLGVMARTFPKEEQTSFFRNLIRSGGQSVDDLGRQAWEAAQSGALNYMPADTSGMGGARMQTLPPEDRAAAAKLYREKRNFALDVRRIERGEYMPIKSAWGEGAPGIVESGIYGMPGVLASSVEAAIPGVGLPLMFLTMQGQAYEDLRNNLRPSMGDAAASEFADTWAPLVAIPATALEKLESMALFGKTPGLTRAFDAMGDMVKNRALRGAARAIGTGMYETSIEATQNMLPALVQQIGHALDSQVSDVKWSGKGGAFDGFWTQNATTFISMLPLSMFGAVGGLNNEARNRAFASASTLERRALGITEEASAELDAAAAAGPSALSRAIDAAWEGRDPLSEDAANATHELAMKEEDFRAALEASKGTGTMPEISQTRASDGTQQYAVRDGETKEEIGTATTAAGAFRIAQTHTAALDSKEKDKLWYLASMLEGGAEVLAMAPTGEARNSFELGTVYTAATAAAESPASIDQFQKQAADDELIAGGTGYVSRIALGRNADELRGEVRGYVNRLFAGASVATIVHEMGHGMLRKLEAAGVIVHEEKLAFVRAVDAGLQGKTTRGEGKQSLALLPAGIADADVTAGMLNEAISHILEADLLRTRRMGKDAKAIKVSPEVISLNIRTLSKILSPAAAAKWQAFSKAVRGMFGLTVTRGLVLQKGLRDGTINAETYHAFIDKVTGRNLPAEHAAMMSEEHASIMGEATAGDAPFSLVRGGNLPMFSTAKVSSLRHDKTEWLKETNPRGQGNEEEAQEIVSNYYKTAVYAGIPKDAVLVAMPSTSGKNILPDALADRISKDFGNAVEKREVAIALARGEAKNKRTFFDKESDPVAFAPNLEVLDDIKGKKVFITEDVHNTGESWIAFARMLMENGVDVVGVAALVSTEQRMTSPRDIERLSEKVAAHTGKSIDDVKPLMHSLFDDTFKQLFNKAEADVTRSAEKASRLVEIAVSGRRAGAYSNPLKNSTGGQSGVLGIGEGLNQETFSFALAPSKMIEGLEMNAIGYIRDPQKRAKAYQKLSRKLQGLRLAFERLELVAGAARRKSSLKKEGAMREAIRTQDLVEEVMTRYEEAFWNEEMTKIKSQPVHAYLADPDSRLRGRLMSKAAALRAHPDMFIVNRPGDYDGADGISRAVFGGRLMPDKAAQELYDEHLIKYPTPDCLWEAIAREQAHVDKNKDYVAKAMEAVRDAKAQAKAETNTWLKEQLGNQSVNFSDKQEILRASAALDAILSVVPAAIRGQVGGYTQLAKLGSNETRMAFLRDRLAMVDKAMERWLKSEYQTEMKALLKRTQPTKDKPGEKPRGKIGADIHDLFRSVEAAMMMTTTEADAEVERLQILAQSPDYAADMQAHYSTLAGLVQLVGGWHPRSVVVEDAHGMPKYVMEYPGADAARMEEALIEATRVYENGYWQARLEASRKREARARTTDALAKATEKAGTQDARKDRAIHDAKLLPGWKDAMLGLGSFSDLCTYIFGEKSEEAQRYADAERWASEAKADNVFGHTDALSDLFTDLAGGGLAGEKLRWAMATEHTPIEHARGTLQMNQMEMIQACLMWRQEDGQRHMLGHKGEDAEYAGPWHYDQAFMDRIEAALTPEAKAVRLHLIEKYAAEYDRLNAVFRRLNGVNLPRHKFYAPLTVNPAQFKGSQESDPTTGFPMSNGFTPGSLKTRSSDAIAEPQFRDAMQTYISHIKQMEHWMAYAPLTQEMNMVLNNRGLRASMEEKAGKQALTVLSGWVELFTQGGTRDAAAHLKVTGIIRDAVSRASRMALVGRVGVLAIQSVQLGAALAEMPTGAYVKRLGMLTSGKLGWGEALDSPYIQRRKKQQPVIVQQAMEGLRGAEPTLLKHGVAKLGDLIGGADALFTAGTYAICLDYHLTQGVENGMTQEDALSEAHVAAERACDRLAQPTRAGARSLYENTTTNPIAKLVWAFASEGRQKLALSAFALANPDASWQRKARAVSVTFLVGGGVSTLIRAVWRDMRDDGEDELFDDKNWNPLRLGLAVLTGPLQGIPVIGDLLGEAIDGFAGQRANSSGLFSNIARAPKALGHVPGWFTGKSDLDEALRDAETILSAMGIMNETLSEAASLSHLVRDGYGLLQNAHGLVK